MEVGAEAQGTGGAEIGEAELLEAIAAGRLADCGDGAERRRVDAGLLRRCCHELKDQVDPRGIRLAKAAIAGQLDLAGLEVPFPLRFGDCGFDSPLMLEGAQLYDLALTGCAQVPGLLANGARIRRDLDLSGSHVAGAHWTAGSDSRPAAVWLCEAEIGGRVLCAGTTIDAGGGRALQADRLRVGGNVRFQRGFTAHGVIRLHGARIDGSLIFHGARLRDPAGVGRRRTGAAALSALRLAVGSEIIFEGDCEIRGAIDLAMSSMSSLLIDSGAALESPGKIALDLTNAEVLAGVTIGEGVPIEGTLRLEGAAIHGNLCLRGVRLSHPEDDGSLVAGKGARIEGDVQLQEVEADGGDLTFRAAEIGGAIAAGGARLRNPAAYTLALVQANVRGSVRLTSGFESSGKVMLNRATIAGRLVCAQGTFDCPAPTDYNFRGHAIEAISASIGGGMDLGWQAVSPSVDFTNARVSFLADDPGRWPARFIVSGFSYERLEQPQGLPPVRIWDHAARCAWLRRQAAYDAGPYEQAARVFRQHGYGSGAQEILIAQRRHARSAITGRGAAARRALDGAYSLTVGYGYRPARVLWAIAALLILVTVSLQVPAARAAMRATNAAGTVYTTAGPLRAAAAAGGARADACGDGEVRCFNPVLLAIDTVIPLVSLDERSTWYPDNGTSAGTAMEWWLNAATILGWLLSSVFVLSLANLARSQ